jgi:hypothetical protein
MVNPNRFYTYAYLREDRTPYYIGKGNGDRVYYKSKYEVKPPKDKSRIIFLKQNITEEEAFRHEKYMIDVFGRKDLRTGILRNKTNGGDGTSGWIPSEKTRKNWSEAKKGENNPNYGKSTSEETRRKQSEVKKGKSRSEETREKISIGMKGECVGKKWWNDGCGNIKFLKECPGEGWVLGMNIETKRKMSRTRKGIKWWNDGCGNHKKSVECPGESWVPGMVKRKRVA